MNDLKEFKHGSEGTHHACQEMVEKLGKNVGCCECNGHECKPNKTVTNNEEALKRFREKFVETEGYGGVGGSGTREVFIWPDNPDFRDWVLIDQIEQFLASELNRREREVADKVFKRIEEKSFSEGSKNKGMIYIDLGVWNELKSKYLSKEEE
jgi:hypothetical protein